MKIEGFEIGLFLLLMITSFVITMVYRNWALKRSVLDIPNERSSHSRPIPRGGGIAIVVTIYAGFLVLFLLDRMESRLFYALLPGLGLALVGLADDLRGLTPIAKFSAQVLCAGLALFFLGGFSLSAGINPGWPWVLMAFFAILWFTNLFNFLDGSDGYASMEAIIVMLALWIFTGTGMLLVVTACVAGFLYWNWPEAKIFMGDTGSTTLGFILVVSGVYLHNSELLPIQVWIVITSLFWFDATLTLIRRMIRKEKLTRAHKKHMYQRAIQGGFSHQKMLLLGLIINLILVALGFFITVGYIPWYAALAGALVIMFISTGYVDRKFSFS